MLQVVCVAVVAGCRASLPKVVCVVVVAGCPACLPSWGDNDAETLVNVTSGEYDFDDESFEDISNSAKDFIGQLLVKRKE